MSSSNKDFVLEVISKYRELPCLWQVTNADYHDKVKRNAAIEELLNLFKTKDPHANKETVLKKINSLRSCFKKEWNKVKSSLTTGKGADEIHVPKLWYYNDMIFLEDQDIPRTSKGISSILEDTPFGDDDNENSDEGEPAQRDNTDESSSQQQGSSRSSTTRSSPTPSRSFKRPRTKADQLLDKISKQLDEPHLTPGHAEKRPFDAFGEHIAEKLRGLSPHMVPICQKLISDTIFNAELNLLTVNSKIETPELTNPVYILSADDNTTNE